MENSSIKVKTIQNKHDTLIVDMKNIAIRNLYIS